MAKTSPARKPPAQKSSEAKPEQLKLARQQGAALQAAVDHMMKEEAQGKEKRAGEYVVGYAVEEAEGMYRFTGGTLKWMEPKRENAHIEISVRDGADKRFIPGLTVMVTVLDARGNEVGRKVHPFLWHPWLFHYGRNWTLPGDGKYTLRVHIDVPAFGRHDKKNGKRYTAPVDVEFPNVRIKTGRKG